MGALPTTATLPFRFVVQVGFVVGYDDERGGLVGGKRQLFRVRRNCTTVLALATAGVCSWYYLHLPAFLVS